MSLEHQGYVGLFEERLTRRRIEELVELWIERFGSVEQAAGSSHQVSTFTIRSVSEIIWENDLQFRILAGEQFAWIYVTPNQRVIETSGLASADGLALSRDILCDTPGCIEIIDEHNDRRLDDLESQGLL